MKKRLYRFFALISSVIVICLSAVAYTYLQDMRLSVWQNKAVIAQSQAGIIQAESQMTINKAVAFEIKANTVLLFILALLPYPFALTIIVLTLATRKIKDENEKL